jgi:2-succinyl-5-enolpyruvyl-6-hydroxy-3-cyclohexene-1-carboxylate synthase
VHDLGSLVTAGAAAAPLAIVVVDNGGGRIFEQLPLAERVSPGDLERLFVTPQEVSIARVADALGLATARVGSAEALRAALAGALGAPRATVIEAVVPPSDAGPRRRALAAAIDRAIAEALA